MGHAIGDNLIQAQIESGQELWRYGPGDGLRLEPSRHLPKDRQVRGHFKARGSGRERDIHGVLPHRGAIRLRSVGESRNQRVDARRFKRLVNRLVVAHKNDHAPAALLNNLGIGDQFPDSE